ncbi:MAG: hypothetical protein ABR547_05490 [Halanaerobium sp.]
MKLFKNKKILAFFVILSIFALVAVGCGGAVEIEEDPVEEPMEEGPVEEEPIPESDDGF